MRVQHIEEVDSRGCDCQEILTYLDVKGNNACAFAIGCSFEVETVVVRDTHVNQGCFESPVVFRWALEIITDFGISPGICCLIVCKLSKGGDAAINSSVRDRKL
jgi:hypothetical protein